MDENKGLESLIEATVKGLREKSDFASRWCKDYTEDCVDKLKQYAESGANCGIECEYCQKFKWIIDRAKHYGKKMELDWKDVLKSWEGERRYWYLNYYQDCNQPEIKSDKVRIFDTVDEMLESMSVMKFRCPACGGISTSPYECNSGIEMIKGKRCDWKVYGLLGDLGKGIFVYCKDRLRGEIMFMPVSWEGDDGQ